MLKLSSLNILGAMGVWVHWGTPDLNYLGEVLITDDQGNLVPVDLAKLYSFVWGFAC